ncbi:MAG TPA: YggT family protein [bacterium]|nr:YggT family protein [bacterium]
MVRRCAGPRILCYNSVVDLIAIVDRAVQLLSILVFVRALLSWIPSVDYRHPLISLIVRITDPILQPVRRLLPPMGGLDLSPLIAILLLNLAGQLLHQLLISVLAPS